MKIGFDAKRAAQNRTGLGNYSRFVLNALTRFAPQEHYLLYAPNPKKTSAYSDLVQPELLAQHYPLRTLSKLFRSLWRVWGITTDLQQDDIQLFHGLSNELPLNICRAKQIRSVVTIHDLIFLRYPRYYHWIDRTIYNYKFRKACQQADRIIAVSQCTKRDIMQYYHIPQEKIAVIYQGCDDRFKKPVDEATKQQVRKKYQLPAHYILYVGSIEERKNLLLLAKALLHLPEDIKVVAVGKRTPYADKVDAFLAANHLQHRMQLTSKISYQDLPAAYQMADCFVYPSEFEGFGIPLLEALCSGVPAIGATGSCLEEAGGPHSLYVHPTDDKGLAAAIMRTLTDEALRRTMIEEGKKYALRFEPEGVAKELVQLYETVLAAE